MAGRKTISGMFACGPVLAGSIFLAVFIGSGMPVHPAGTFTGQGQFFVNRLLALPDEAGREKALGNLIASSSSPAERRKLLEAVAASPELSSNLRMMAVCALEDVATAESLRVLLPLLRRELKERRGLWGCMIPVLGGIGDRRALPLLESIAEKRDDYPVAMWQMAFRAIGMLADRRDVAFLERHADLYPVRSAIVETLARIAAPRSAALLAAALFDPEDTGIPAVAEKGLRRIGRAALPALLEQRRLMRGHMSAAQRRRLAGLIDAIRKRKREGR